MSKQARVRSTGATFVTALNLEFEPMSSTTRRGFLQQTGALAASTVLFGCRAAPKAQPASEPGELGFESAVDLVGMLKSKQVGSEELTRYFIDRIEKYDETLNAVVVRDFDRALDAARAADTALARGEVLGSLHGLLFYLRLSLPSTLEKSCVRQTKPVGTVKGLFGWCR